MERIFLNIKMDAQSNVRIFDFCFVFHVCSVHKIGAIKNIYERITIMTKLCVKKYKLSFRACHGRLQVQRDFCYIWKELVWFIDESSINSFKLKRD